MGILSEVNAKGNREIFSWKNKKSLNIKNYKFSYILQVLNF
jgi:hypothetical protein